MKKALVALAAIGLMAFSCDRGVSLTPCGEVFATKGELEIIVKHVADYAEQPKCSRDIIVACANQSVVNELSKTADAVAASLDRAEAVCMTEPNTTLVTVEAARSLLLSLTNTYANEIARVVQ